MMSIAMKTFFASPKVLMTIIALLALVVIPLTIVQVQNQQIVKQDAEEILWDTTQSASTSCPANGQGAEIKVIFTNTEPNRTSLAMDVIAKDQQTGKSVNMGTIKGGETKIDVIQTGKSTLQAGTVTFSLKWSDGHSGTDSRSASYRAVGNCIQPTPTPTRVPTPTKEPTPTLTPTPYPTGQPTPTPTICPTLKPVQNVRIECPNCP